MTRIKQKQQTTLTVVIIHLVRHKVQVKLLRLKAMLKETITKVRIQTSLKKLKDLREEK